jgi:hypothetical protein
MARKVHGLIAMLFDCNIALLKRATITPIDIEGRRYIPVDVDVSTLNNGKSHKEGVGRTYMGTDGYEPIFSYIGTEGYMLCCELRPGTQHSQKGTPEFLVRNLEMIKELGLLHPVLFLLDSGNDAIDTIKKLVTPPRRFLLRNVSPQRSAGAVFPLRGVDCGPGNRGNQGHLSRPNRTFLLT